MAGIIGEIYRLHLPKRDVVIISTNALVNEVCDEKRFKKSINSALNVYGPILMPLFAKTFAKIAPSGNQKRGTRWSFHGESNQICVYINYIAVF